MKNIIPDRHSNALTGSQFAKKHLSTNYKDRDKYVLDEILSGNIPDFNKQFIKITTKNERHTLSYFVSPNYLTLGTNEDYLIIPVSVKTAQNICSNFDCSLPTKVMVNQIWESAINKLEPIPFGPPYDSSMFSMQRYLWSNNEIFKQMSGKDITKLTAGHKKDLVISNKLSPNNYNQKVCIYGWHKLNGEPIQELNYFTHEVTYQDYSQVPRLIANDVIIDNKFVRLQDIFVDPVLCNLISNEGIMTFVTY